MRSLPGWLRGRCGRGTGLSPGDPKKGQRARAGRESRDGSSPAGWTSPGRSPLARHAAPGRGTTPAGRRSRGLAVQLFGALLDSSAAAVTFWIAAPWFRRPLAPSPARCTPCFFPGLGCHRRADAGRPGRPVPGFRAGCVREGHPLEWSPRLCLYGVAGLALGAGSYFRLDYLLLPLAMLPPLWLLTRRASVAVAGTTMVMAAVVLALLPWAYRNHLQFDQWMFTTTGAGANLITSLGSSRIHGTWDPATWIVRRRPVLGDWSRPGSRRPCPTSSASGSIRCAVIPVPLS